MAEIKKEDFFKHLDGLTVLELADYIKEFEERYGIKAEMAAMPVGVAAPAAADAEEAEEKTDFGFDQFLLPASGSQEDGGFRRSPDVHGFPLRHDRRYLHRH